MMPARLLESESDLRSEHAMDEPAQLATLKVDVDYIKSNVIEIKAGLTRLDEKLGTVVARVSQGEKSVLQLEKSLIEKIDGVEKGLIEKIDVGDRRLTEKIDDVDKRLTAKIDDVDKRITAVDKHLVEKFGEMRLWVMGLYVTQAAGLLFVMAKGFKWI